MRRIVDRRLEIGAAVCAALVVMVALQLHGSTPTFRHDWQWPALAEMLRALARQKLDAWWWAGFGGPNIAVQVHPYFVVPALASSMLAPFPILLVVCACVWALAAGSMAALLRERFGAAGGAAFAGAMLYAFAPLVVVKTVAGHLPYLAAYAVVPAALWAALGDGLLCAVVLAGAVAWATLQVQVLAVLIVLSFVFRRLRLRYAAAASALGVCAGAAHWWTLIRPGATGATLAMLTSLPWEQNLSAPLGAALMGTGYFRPYWEHAQPPGTTIVYVVFAALYSAAALAAPFFTTFAFRWRIAAIYVAGVALVAGLNGPLALPLAAAFGVVPAASAFRELYDLSILIVVAGSIGAGVLLSRFGAGASTFVAVAVTLVAVAPWLGGGVLSQTGTDPDAARLGAVFDRLADAAPLTRFLISPAVNPVGPREGSPAGADPLAFGYRELMPLWIYLPEAYEPDYLWLLAADRNGRVHRSLGVSAIVRRTSFETKRAAERGWPVRPGFLGATLVPDGLNGRAFGEIEIYELPRPLPILQLATRRFRALATPNVAFDAARGTDPLHGFAPIADVWDLSAMMAAGAPSGVMTFARDASVRVTCAHGQRRIALAAIGHGAIDGRPFDAGSWTTTSVDCLRPLQAAAAPMIGFAPLADVTNAGAIAALLTAGRQPLASLRRDGDTLTARVPACARCALVLAERFDPGWTLLRPDGTPLVASDAGGFNVWNLDLRANDVVRVAYHPAANVLAAVAVSVAAWAAITCALAALGFAALARRR
jgi:hypothetical protein